jgi:hypothetical protein
MTTIASAFGVAGATIITAVRSANRLAPQPTELKVHQPTKVLPAVGKTSELKGKEDGDG